MAISYDVVVFGGHMKSVTNTKNNILLYLRGALTSVSVSLIAILIFALLIRVLGISDNLIMPINQVIKITSIFVGVWVALQHNKKQGIVRGLIIGVLYTLIAYLVFSILSQSWTFNLTTFYDLLFGALIGAICGVIIVNIKQH